MRRDGSNTWRKALRRSLLPVLPVRDAVHFPGVIATLQVARDPSLKALRKALEAERLVVVLSQRDMAVEEPSPKDLHRIGTLSETLQALPLPDSSQRATLRGLERVAVTRIVVRSGAFWADVEPLSEDGADRVETEALARACLQSFRQVVTLHKEIPAEALDSVAAIEDAGEVADAIAHHLPGKLTFKQSLLEQANVIERLESLLAALKREEQVLVVQQEIGRRFEAQLGSAHREFTLREQMRIIQEELDGRERAGETAECESLLSEAGFPCDAADKARADIRRLDRISASSPEGTVIRSWLDVLLGLPWNKQTEDSLDVARAAAILDRDHYGLQAVKDRILDYVAVRRLTSSARGPILCFVGPPGVGKTSIGRSVAEALGRSFARLSLGGIRDEAEIRGHRRTYVGAMPGRIIRAIQHAGSRNPVLMLDEIDKLGSDWRGDPASALLEALDPEQNGHFEDHYLDVPFDLSAVLFIATANVVETIPAALRDRMEVIAFRGYSDEERAHIARCHLIPGALKAHGLTDVEFDPAALWALVQDYSRESGVRELERQIAAVCRKLARQIVEQRTQREVLVDKAALMQLLGQPQFRRPVANDHSEPGVATGLVVGETGGELVHIEVSLTPPYGDTPELRLTGRMGEVMRESAEAALTWVRGNAEALCPSKPFRYDVHVHVPDAGVPKEGPSAGLTIAMALASAFMGRSLRTDVAMSGEITLRGRVLAVGGLREKLMAAHRAGLREVIIPKDNERDLEDLPASARAGLQIRTVSTAHEALALALVESQRAMLS